MGRVKRIRLGILLLACVAGGPGCVGSFDLPPLVARDIEFAETEDGPLALDLYIPRDRGEAPAPVVVWLHGGGWVSGDRRAVSKPLMHELTDRGYVVAAPSYRLATVAPFPAQIHDVKAAVRFLRANAVALGLDPERIGITGGSSGGHLAALAGTTHGVVALEGDVGGEALAAYSSEVAAVVSWFGPTDLTDFDVDGTGSEIEWMLESLVGGEISESGQALRDASPLFWVSGDAAPMMHVHGTLDPVVPFEQSVRMDEALGAAGVESLLRPVEGAGHGTGGDFETDVLEREAVDFFDRHLAP